jgi:hypothetical protein
MPAARLQPIVLKSRQFQSTRGQRWAAATIAILFFAGTLWLMNTLLANPFGDFDRAALAKLLDKLSERWRETPTRFVLNQAELFLVVIAGFLHLWYFRRASKYERLMLDETGIRYQSPLPQALRGLQPDWSLRWSQVRAARIAVPRMLYHPNLAVLELDAAPKKRKIFVLRWVDSADASDRSMSWRDRFFSGTGTKLDVERTLKEIEESPLVRYARRAGVAITTDLSRGIGSGFSLESNRNALVGTVLVIALLCYAVVDLAVNEEAYAVDPPLVLFALGGAIVALVGLLWFASAGVPRAETLGLSLLLGGACGFALYPGALRVNAATDSQGLHTYDYRLTSYVVFSPLDTRLPELTFPSDADYWGQFKLGTVHPFELRKGGLGFYQVNMAPVHAKMHDYFASKN